MHKRGTHALIKLRMSSIVLTVIEAQLFGRRWASSPLIRQLSQPLISNRDLNYTFRYHWHLSSIWRTLLTRFQVGINHNQLRNYWWCSRRQSGSFKIINHMFHKGCYHQLNRTETKKQSEHEVAAMLGLSQCVQRNSALHSDILSELWVAYAIKASGICKSLADNAATDAV